MKSIDYEELNKRIKEITGEELSIDKNNANKKLKNLFFERIIKMSKLNYSIDSTSKYQKDNSKIIEFENDEKIFYNATEILLNVFNYEKDIILSENYNLFLELIISNDVQQILKDDIPNLIKISQYIQINFNIDIANIAENILNLFETIDYEKLTINDFFTIINDELERFLKMKNFYN